MASIADTTSVENPLGGAIREHRLRLGFTLVDLAARAELSQPFLSQIENGRAQPSLGSLQRIANALDTTPQTLFGATTPGTPQLVRAGTRPRFPVTSDDATPAWYSVLIGGGAPVRVVTFDGLPAAFGDPFQHPGYEITYVIAGSVDIDIDGEVTTLHAGDAIAYDSALPHRHRQHETTPAKMLLIETSATGHDFDAASADTHDVNRRGLDDGAVV